MKLLAVSDLHFGLPQFDWIALQAERFDGVIIAGDLLDIAGHLDLDAQITVVAKYLRTLASRTRLFVCSGNHDGDEATVDQEYVARWLLRVRAEGLTVDGSGLDLGAYRVSVCPWWDGPATRSAMQAFLERERALATDGWIWVHHAPPDKLGVSWTGKAFHGDPFLTDTIRELKPTLVFSGHIHDSPFRSGGTWASRLGDTWIFNAGRTSGAPPAVIELDLASQTATWISQAGVESVDLREPPPAV
jgi:Icc-related predicted phosphoesterase